MVLISGKLAAQRVLEQLDPSTRMVR